MIHYKSPNKKLSVIFKIRQKLNEYFEEYDIMHLITYYNFSLEWTLYSVSFPDKVSDTLELKIGSIPLKSLSAESIVFDDGVRKPL